MKKSTSIMKKIANLEIRALSQGMQNFKSGVKDNLALGRAAICEACPHREDEPIDELQVIDEIESISKKCCGVCGCTLSYLLRQTLKPCADGRWL